MYWEKNGVCVYINHRASKLQLLHVANKDYITIAKKDSSYYFSKCVGSC